MEVKSGQRRKRKKEQKSKKGYNGKEAEGVSESGCVEVAL